MSTNSVLSLSNYQRAILNEMGVSCWVLSNDKNGHEKIDPTVIAAPQSTKNTTKPDSISKEAALSKIAKLKQSTKRVDKALHTQELLLALKVDQPLTPLFEDVLLALGLTELKRTTIKPEQIENYQTYPFYWGLAADIKLLENRLSTPNIEELQKVQNKKYLWKTIQQHIKG